MDDVLEFDTADDLAAWLARHAEAAGSAWIALPGVAPGRAGLRYAEAAEAAADAGWVETARRSVDGTRYAVRFAPGEVTRAEPPADLAPRAWEGQEPVLDPEFEAEFRADEAAWEFFQAQRPAYRRAAIWWVTSGKHEDTRRRRIDALIAGSARGERLPQLVRNL